MWAWCALNLMSWVTPGVVRKLGERVRAQALSSPSDGAQSNEGKFRISPRVASKRLRHNNSAIIIAHVIEIVLSDTVLDVTFYSSCNVLHGFQNEIGGQYLTCIT
ncbi:hypothetical protein AVEN_108212-1 [Araneus ventricosus]|uniref:Secreted protein n=1 Tax=Araneus ventricosus TaxID=182803 RepID=A0A4Y2I2S6_ARAVE|nr:hypothetical protein AVEN_108212-1 [Araneus ventricosus]